MSYEREIVAIIKLRVDIQEILQRLEDNAAGDIGELADALIERVRALVRSGAIKGREVELLHLIDSLVFQGSEASTQILIRNVDAVLDLSVRLGVTAASLFKVPPDRIATLVRNFDSTFRIDLRTEGYTRWLEMMPETTLKPLSDFRRLMADGMARGLPTNKIAEAFVNGADLEIREDGSTVITDLPPIRQKIDPYLRARRVVRTEYARIDNTASIAFSESYGATHFRNFGTGDERQSLECQIASKSEPRTLASWASWVVDGLEIGIAPRHVANCRCLMIGVPPDYRDTISVDQIRKAGGIE